MTETRYGSLVLVEKINTHGKARWLCMCDCGGRITLRLDDLKNRVKLGTPPSCGCTFHDVRSRISLGLFDSTQYMQKRYGRLLVTGVVTDINCKAKAGKRLVCLCDCGAQVVVRPDSLMNGNTKSCGCVQKEIAAALGFELNFIHGKTIYGELISGLAPIYQVWSTIRKCVTIGWRRGAHRVCHEYDPRWDDFGEFFKDFGEITATQGISRTNNKMPWSKENCYIHMNSSRLTKKKNKMDATQC